MLLSHWRSYQGKMSLTSNLVGSKLLFLKVLRALLSFCAPPSLTHHCSQLQRQTGLQLSTDLQYKIEHHPRQVPMPSLWLPVL
jgi:hypothetical protein